MVPSCASYYSSLGAHMEALSYTHAVSPSVDLSPPSSTSCTASGLLALPRMHGALLGPSLAASVQTLGRTPYPNSILVPYFNLGPLFYLLRTVGTFKFHHPYFGVSNKNRIPLIGMYRYNCFDRNYCQCGVKVGHLSVSVSQSFPLHK